MTKTARVAILCALAALGGCTEPAVALKPLAVQESAVTVRDWSRVALAIADRMSMTGLLAPPIVAGGRPIPVSRPYGPYYVQVLAPGSTFLKEVADALRGAILRRGGSVATTPEGATVVNLDDDVVRWGSMPVPPNGLFTLLGAAGGVAALAGSGGHLTPLAGAGVGLGSGIALDTVLALAPKTRAEVVWKATIQSRRRLLMEMRRPMYISAHDVPLYLSELHLAATSSPGRRLFLRARRMRIDP